MKRIKNIWCDVVNEDWAFAALMDATAHKRGKRQVRKLLYSKEDVQKDKALWHRIDPAKGRPYVHMLCESLKDGTWEHKPPRYKRQFCSNRTHQKGKWRDLYIPTLDDHVIHHMVMQASMEAFTRGMHPHSCGSVPGRGIKHLVHWVSHWTQHDRQCRYFVKLDIRKYFDNIDADRLKAILRRKIKDKDVLRAHDQIIDSAPVACPVGYYPSPWYANLYLEQLDWYIEQDLYKERRGKRIKYVRHYLRYVDDILLIGTSKSDLYKAVSAIKVYLMEHYGLEIKPTWEIKKIGKHEIVDGDWKLKDGTYWCDMGGYKFCKDCTVLRDGVYLSTKRLAKKISKQGYYTEHQCRAINARLAWAQQCDSTHFIDTNIKPYINIKDTRKEISHVDKIRQWRDCNPATG